MKKYAGPNIPVQVCPNCEAEWKQIAPGRPYCSQCRKRLDALCQRALPMDPLLQELRRRAEIVRLDQDLNVGPAVELSRRISWRLGLPETYLARKIERYLLGQAPRKLSFAEADLWAIGLDLHASNIWGFEW